MNPGTAVELSYDALFLTLILAGPIMLIGMLVGLVISVVPEIVRYL